MKRFAANRVYCVEADSLYRNWVVEIDDQSHFVLRTFALTEEIRQTEWKGGIILLCKESPVREVGETYAVFISRCRILEKEAGTGPLQAFHLTAFDVNAMEFTNDSRIIRL